MPGVAPAPGPQAGGRAPEDGVVDVVRALGPVRHLVSPNKLHHLFLGAWQARFPDAKLWGTASTIDS